MTMCYKDRTSRIRTMIKKKKSMKARKPARRCRTKTRKPKFLSLISLEISSEKAQQSSDMPSSTRTDTKDQQQLYLFPLHPENLVEDKDNHDENMAYLFSAADGSASTLTGLLGAATASCSGEDDKNQCAELSHSAALSYSYEGEVKQAVALARTALKNKERDSSEERYVRYSEVVERRDEEVSSSAADLRYGNRNLLMMKVENQRLSLKLDYEEILNAWSDKGSLYVYADSPPQTVPDIHDDFLPPDSSNGVASNHGWRNYGGLWMVPELARSSVNVNEIKAEEEQQQQQPVGAGAGAGAEEWKLGQREASVLRYKEKRQNRLFSKRIRYQVRKLNAEKRPRVKGRFVKRS